MKIYRNYNKKFIILSALFIVTLFLIACNSNENTNINENANAQTFETIATGSTETDDVLVELTPLGVNNGILSVEIRANTHFVGLEQFDLMEITTLNAGGKLVKPSKAPQLGGHHTSGVLEFAVGKSIKEFTIIIKGIPKTEERVFTWRR